MKSAQKYTYSFFFLAFSLLSLNLSMWAMKRELFKDSDLTIEKKDLNSTVILPLISISSKNARPFFDLILIMRDHFSNLNIPINLIEKVLKFSIKADQVNICKIFPTHWNVYYCGDNRN